MVALSEGGAPLTLQAVKSMVGHTETAAGVVGLAQPLVGLVRMCTANILHLASLNPHIQGVIRSAAKATGGAGAARMQMPRQCGAQIISTTNGGGNAGGAVGSASGASGFAFQVRLS